MSKEHSLPFLIRGDKVLCVSVCVGQKQHNTRTGIFKKRHVETGWKGCRGAKIRANAPGFFNNIAKPVAS